MNYKNRKTVRQLFFVIFFIFGVMAFSLPPQYSENEIKAMYIIKFSHFTEWKDMQHGQNKIIIGVYGKSVIVKYLKKYVLTNKEENKDLEIKIIKSLDEVVDCNVLYFPDISVKELEMILNKLNNLPVLTISDNQKFLEKNVMINMFPRGRKVVYSVNKSSVDLSSLKLSPKIYKLAIEVKQNND